ncbi:methyltransferase type 12 [Pontibacillus chungwhensis BH030062]|uniref:Methyltransferase type 12 n=1 Tax=Pontibacillus chungwhensis BH030062 TaxID=1385513 RepID=A0A0A2UWU5_9BACI|nr:class I SAM-dependent methyltransferase [Pontibacillus chungwhensis]KGP90996.1 methyltransferase type 12 [Pontibacillus chungwhensis BH030062]
MNIIQTALKARNWMKRNESFLPTWHAYVGYELDLFKTFKNPKTVDEVVAETGLSKELLQCWVDVGASIKHLRKRTGGRYRTSKHHCGEFLEDGSNSVGALLKEMMELHIPTLLAYPKYMKSNERAVFNHEKFGDVVAETSTLLEHFAIRRIKKMMKEHKVETVIDLGCGHGGYLRKLAKDFPEVQMLGVDVNERVVESARKASAGYDNIDYIVADASDWRPEEGEKADLILLHNVFHYLDPIARTELLSNLTTWLSDEGRISVITPVNETAQGQAFSTAFNSFFTAHSNLYALPSSEDIEELADASGLTLSDYNSIIKEGGWYAFWLMPQTVSDPEVEREPESRPLIASGKV